MRDRDFERLFAEHAQPLFGFLVYRTGDRSVAEDILADTFERVLSSRRGFDRRKASEKTWIYSIALNRLRDHLRREASERRALDRVRAGLPGGPADDPSDRAERRDAVVRALALLPEEEREAIALRYGAALTVPEIASLTGLPLRTVEGRVYRALGRMRRGPSNLLE